MSNQVDSGWSLPDELQRKVTTLANNDVEVDHAWKKFRAAGDKDAEVAKDLLHALDSYPCAFLEVFSRLHQQAPPDMLGECLLNALIRWPEETIVELGIVELMDFLITHGVSSRDPRVCTRLLELYRLYSPGCETTLKEFLLHWEPNAAAGATWWLLGERPRGEFTPIHASMLLALTFPPDFFPEEEVAALREWFRRHKSEIVPKEWENALFGSLPSAASLVAARAQIQLGVEDLINIVSQHREARRFAFECVNRGVAEDDPLNDPRVLCCLLRKESSFLCLRKALTSWASKLGFDCVFDILSRRRFPKSQLLTLYKLMLERLDAPRLDKVSFAEHSEPPAKKLYVIIANARVASILLIRKRATLLRQEDIRNWAPWLQVHADTRDFMVCYYQPGNPKPPVSVSERAQRRFANARVFVLQYDETRLP